ncbi:hypothetical protein HK405_008929, partial [Cladochytrium tenue]
MAAFQLGGSSRSFDIAPGSPAPAGGGYSHAAAASAATAASSLPVPRDSTFAVIELGSHTVKAGRSDYLVAPAIRVRSRAVVRQQRTAQQQHQQDSGDDAAAMDVVDEDGTAASNGEFVYGTDDADSAAGVVHALTPYGVASWPALEGLMYVQFLPRIVGGGKVEKHVLVKELGVRRRRNATPVLVAVPPTWGVPDVERLVQLMFETMNVPGLYIADVPLMAAFGCGVLSGLVIDFGHESITVSPIIDCVLQRHAVRTVPVGGATVRRYLRQLLLEQPEQASSTVAAADPEAAPLPRD